MTGLPRALSLSLCALLWTASARAQMVPPANDECVNAIQIGDGTIFGTTIGSTISTNGCGLSGLTPDVWYSYTATRQGLLALDTCGSSFDPSITLYAFCGAPFEIVCNDDAPPGSPCGYFTFDSYLTYPIRAGETVKIRVSGFVGSQGAFVLRTRTDTGHPFCLGDNSSSTVCPCGNTVPVGTIGGCKNSNGSGGKLGASGFADMLNDTVRLTASGLPPGAPILFFQGSAKQAGGYGQSFGDGIRCVTGTIWRLRTKFASGDTAVFPVAGEPSLHAAGFVPQAGGVVLYQGWYRNGASFCLPSTFNLTNGVEVAWSP